MKILALDSSGLVASAAVVEDDVLIAEYTTDYKKTSSLIAPETVCSGSACQV